MLNGLLFLFLLVLCLFSVHAVRLLPKKGEQSIDCTDCTKHVINSKRCKAEQFFLSHAEYRVSKKRLNESAVLYCMGTVDTLSSICRVERNHYEKVRVECIFTDQKDLEVKLVELEKREAEEQRIEDEKSQKSGQEASETSNGWNILALVAFGLIMLALLIAAIWLIMKRMFATRQGKIDHVEVATNQARIIERVEILNERRTAPLDFKTAVEDENRDEVSMDAKEKTDSGKKESRR